MLLCFFGDVHPGRLPWNLQITHLERNMIFQTSIIVFHVNLPGWTVFVAKHTNPRGSKPAETNSVGRKRWMVKSGEWLFLLSQAVSFFLGEVFFLLAFCFVLWTLLPGKLTWNPKMELWKMIFLFKQVIFRFHVSFRGCRWC